MTAEDLCTPGRAELLKLAVHGGMLVGACACAIYNLGALYHRRERHNAVNAVAYGLLVALELAHVRHHLEHFQD